MQLWQTLLLYYTFRDTLCNALFHFEQFNHSERYNYVMRYFILNYFFRNDAIMQRVISFDYFIRRGTQKPKFLERLGFIFVARSNTNYWLGKPVDGKSKQLHACTHAKSCLWKPLVHKRKSAGKLPKSVFSIRHMGQVSSHAKPSAPAKKRRRIIQLLHTREGRGRFLYLSDCDQQTRLWP